jgi:hypothetical protein
MEPKGSLPYSQEPSTVPYPEPDQSNPYHPRWVPCNNGMACPQVADRGDALQVFRSRGKPSRGGPPAGELGVELTTHRKK